MFLKQLGLYYSREACKKNEEAFFRKKEVERGYILLLAHVFGCYKLALLFEKMLDYVTVFCTEILPIHLSVREMCSLCMVSTTLFIEEIHRRFPGAWDRMYLSGFSLGGNVIIKFFSLLVGTSKNELLPVPYNPPRSLRPRG